MTQLGLVFHGLIIDSVTQDDVRILEECLLLVNENGCILQCQPNVQLNDLEKFISASGAKATEKTRTHILPRGEFLIPGFVDTHNHAPQWAQRGLGRGLQIIDWLNQITFKNEARFENVEYAREVYSKCVDGFLQQGITTVSYYGSLHGEATKILADLCLAKGQRALIGKCNMDRNGAEFYKDESAAESIAATEGLIEHIRRIDPKFALIKPILTPRFAICCTEELLDGLGKLSEQYSNIPNQTHFNEARSEIDFTMSLFPKFTNEADLYHSFGLLNNRSILAHCCHMTEYEIKRLRELDCGVAHCPISNTTVGGGFMVAPIREFLRQGIKVGLGTDSGGGFSSSILDAMRQAFIVSNAGEMMSDGKNPSLSVNECFYMATLGGAKVCGLEDKTGSFVVGKEFDAQHIRTINGMESHASTMIEDSDDSRMLFEKFLMSGDDRNIEAVWVRGKEVKRA